MGLALSLVLGLVPSLVLSIGPAVAIASSARSEALAAEAPPCRVEVVLEPPTAYVGQQVSYRLRILRQEGVSRLRWITPLSFPNARSEWLPGRVADPRISGIGRHEIVFEERRALFPAVGGEIATPEAVLACRVGEGAAAEEIAVTVPPALLRVEALPAEGRPEGFSGLVGPARVRAFRTPERVALGGFATVRVRIDAPGNVWDVADPLEALEGWASDAAFELFAEAPELELEPRERLWARRTFTYSLVPRREGRLAFPPIAVPYFDPSTGRYAIATAQLAALEVWPADASLPGDTDPRRPREPVATREAPPADAEPRSGRGLTALATALLVAAIALALRRRRRAPTALRAAALDLRRAEDCRAAGDADGTARALDAALRAALAAHRRSASVSPRTPPDTAAGATSDALRDAVRLLEHIERARFAAADPAETLPSPDAVRDAIRRL